MPQQQQTRTQREGTKMFTIENIEVSSATLSQQALDIYDQSGEFAMLPFMMNNVRPSTNDAENWEQRGYCQLDNGSAIVHAHEKYTFSWYNRETGEQSYTEHYSAMPETGRPEPTQRKELPVMSWPNRKTVWSAVIDIIEARSDYHTDECVITVPEISYWLSPSLYQSISRAIDKSKTDL